ncbi:amino acid adenylation domain-containing protein [Burkholderia gladioli]|uniref:amino acid adenylation domain-containing protein n=1 Tax=Burkholderia gladioli TaxID=28095 RepID=UPI001FC8D997|nr:amino acid adenylation domain-containing protein [Burkholderia gladioli]
MFSTEPARSGSAAATQPSGARSLHAAFHEQALRFPDRVAASDGERRLAYAELDRMSSRLAGELRRAGVTPGMVVGLYVGRGVQLLVGLLGILKAGAAYLPIDPGYPAQRVAHIVEDSGLSVLVDESTEPAPLAGRAVRSVHLDALWSALAAPGAADEAHEVHASNPDDLAYVIYTSGSTGKPKGVMVEHRNALRLVARTSALFGFDERDVWSMFHSIGFDFAVWEIWGAWLSGARVEIVPYAVSRAPEQFRAWLASTGVTVLNQTPSAFRNLEAADRAGGAPLALRHVIFGGEALSHAVLAPWIARHGDHAPALTNMYGITETTVHVTHQRVTRAAVEAAPEAMASIGVAIDDLRLHLLDAQRKPVPVGAIGEIYVEGAGLARGYLNQPALTEERFVSLATAEGATVRAYRSGDLAVRGEGGLVHAGRADDQMKIRGFRIEPGEIEAALQRSARIRASHACGHDFGDGDVRVIAYVVPAEGASLAAADEAALREAAARDLPDYMRPSVYVALAALPLTEHGKIDRRALPAPGAAPAQAAPAIVLDEEQSGVLEVWRDLLGLKTIGLHDDFFDAGGTSLALIRSIAAIKARFRINLDLSALASGATAQALADVIRANRAGLALQAK